MFSDKLIVKRFTGVFVPKNSVCMAMSVSGHSAWSRSLTVWSIKDLRCVCGMY